MIQRTRWLLPVLFVTLPACSTSQGFDRGEIQESLHQRLTFIGEPEPKASPEKLPNFAGPFRLGLYFVRTEFPARQSLHTTTWISTEQDALVHRLSQLREDRIVSEIVVLAEPTALTLTRQELRQGALRYGIDALVVIDGIGSIDRHNNAYSFLYPTIIGAWLSPGTVCNALFVIDSRLWNVRTDAFGDRQTAEGQAQTIGAAVLANDADVLKEAKRRAIEAFGATFVEHLRSLRRDRSDPPSSLR